MPRNPREPIASLVAKSEKAQRKLRPGSWQHRMMAENLRALRFALVLMDGGSARVARCAGEDSEEVLRALAAMRRRSEHARHAFVRGTSQHTLQHNRIAALRAAETLVKAAQGRRGFCVCPVRN